MTLTRWEIVFARENDADSVGHPAVILSGPDLLSDERHLRFSALIGTKCPSPADVLAHQVLLDQADGLEFATLVNCAIVYVVRKKAVLRKAGILSHQRRAEIARRVRASLGVW